ncbi:hypothetical protein VN23_18485 [Janthinobacterium sp. B9-8]|nr:hypothetical protein VN23_18485 [Janthinobacterium sp. B9-8]
MELLPCNKAGVPGKLAFYLQAQDLAVFLYCPCLFCLSFKGFQKTKKQHSACWIRRASDLGILSCDQASFAGPV